MDKFRWVDKLEDPIENLCYATVCVVIITYSSLHLCTGSAVQTKPIYASGLTTKSILYSVSQKSILSNHQ